MELKVIDCEFSVCKVKSFAGIDISRRYTFTACTDEELSLVCPTEFVPAETLEREDGWRAFRICGVLDFSLVGILAKISAVLADSGIGIFAVSTYNTDYVLTKAKNFSRALDALRLSGYTVI